MSHPAWTTGASEPLRDAEAQGVLTPAPAHDPGPHHHHTHPQPDADDRDDKPDDAPAGRRLALKREARFGIAAMLSFLVLVTVLILSKGGGRDKTAPVTQIAAGSKPVAPDAVKTPVVPGPKRPADDPPAVAARGTPEPAPAPSQTVEPHLVLAKQEGTPPPTPAPAPAPAPGAPKDADASGDHAPTPPAPAPAPVADGNRESPKPEDVPLPVPADPVPKPEPGGNPLEPPLPAAVTPEPANDVGTNPKAPADAPRPAPSVEAGPPPAPTGSDPVASPSPAPAPSEPQPAEPPAVPAAAPATNPATPPGDLGPALPDNPAVAPAPAASPGGPAPTANPPEAAPPASTEPLPAAVPAPSAATMPEPSPPPAEPKPAEGAPGAAASPASAAPPSTLPNLSPAPDPAPAPARPSGEGEWVPLPTAGRARPLDDNDRPAPDPAPRPDRRVEPQPAPSSAAGLPPSADEAGRVEPVPHVVQRRENFWTISRLYYGSGRFYKALWAANRATVPAVDKLYVGQTIRIPPPEDLDRALIDPDRPARAGRPSPTSGSTSAPARKASRATAPGEFEVALPASDPFARRRAEPDDPQSEPGPRFQPPRRPVYKVRPHETLRSIARDALGDSRRADEILELNAGVIDDPNHLINGQLLELPDDAKVGSAASGGVRRRP